MLSPGASLISALASLPLCSWSRFRDIFVFFFSFQVLVVCIFSRCLTVFSTKQSLLEISFRVSTEKEPHGTTKVKDSCASLTFCALRPTLHTQYIHMCSFARYTPFTSNEPKYGLTPTLLSRPLMLQRQQSENSCKKKQVMITLADDRTLERGRNLSCEFYCIIGHTLCQ